MPETRDIMDWGNFSKAFLEAGGGTYVIPGSPKVEFRVEPGRRLTMCTPCNDVEALSRFRLDNINVDSSTLDGVRAVVLSVGASALQASFYQMACQLADRLQNEGTPLEQSIELTLGAWSKLIATKPRMTPEDERGLWGELLVLEHLLTVVGTSDWTWTGPEGDDHDFRTEKVELEVKTHLGSTRKHWISNLNQLQPSPEHDLYVVSILLAVGPGGMTLPQRVARVRNLGGIALRDRLNVCLKRKHYSDDEAIHYAQRLIVRGPVGIIPVDSQVPALTRPVVQNTLGKCASRLVDAKYQLDLDGLEHMPGSEAFEAALPGFKGDDHA